MIVKIFDYLFFYSYILFSLCITSIEMDGWKMKKIITFVFFVFSFIFTLSSCNKSYEPKDVISSYLDSIESYSIDGEMTLYKNDKEIKSTVKVDYLKPSYYKVTFSRSGGNEQILLKNNEGVFVLTPALNKEFKFNSEWPDNELHCYLVNVLWKKIKDDSNTKYQEKNNEIIISLELDDLKYTKLEMIYNTKSNAIEEINLYKDSNIKAKYDINSINLNPKLTESDFSVSLIMNEKTIASDSEAIAKSFTISASISLDDVVLSSSKVTETESILCYSGAKNYTIIAKRASLNGEDCYTTFSDYSVLECGLMLYSTNVTLLYYGDLEVSIYSNSLTMDELEEISANIVVNE